MACDLSVIVDDALHPPRRPGARIGAGRRGDAVAAAHRRRPTRAGDRHAVRAGERRPRRSSGGSSRAWCPRGARRHRGRDGSQARAQAPRGDALHEDPAQLVAGPRVVTDRRARARLAGDPLHRRRDAGGRRRLPRQASPALRRPAASRGRRGTGVPSSAARPGCRRPTSSAGCAAPACPMPGRPCLDRRSARPRRAPAGAAHRPRAAQPAEAAQRAQRRGHGCAVRDARGARPRRRGARDRGDRQRARLRRGR